MTIDRGTEKQQISFAKVVATPTATSWSQIYNAGSFFVVLSLSSIDGVQNDNLNAIEKEIFNNLEAEFFSLEEKTLKTITEAIEKTHATFPQNVSVSLGVAYITEDILYIVVLGGASVYISRYEGSESPEHQQNRKVGRIIGPSKSNDLQSASGRLMESDIIIIQTKKFTSIIPHDVLLAALKHKSVGEIADELSPIVSGKDEAEAASIILMYHEPKHEEQNQQVIMPDQSDTSAASLFLTESPQRNSAESTVENSEANRGIEQRNTDKMAWIRQVREKIGLASRSLRGNLAFGGRSGLFFSHSRKVYFSIFVVLLITLAASIIFALRHQQQQKIEKQFQEIHTAAQKKYDEGSEIASLNKILAREDLAEAEGILKNGMPNFNKDSKEYDKLASLLSDVEKKLSEFAQVHGVAAIEVDENKSQFLRLVKKFSSEGKLFTSDNNFVYFINDQAVFSVDRGNEKKRELVKNNGSWKDIGGFDKYLTNFYVLDTKDGITKFVPSGDTYTKSDYFSGDKPGLTQAVAIAIDSSIWVLSKNGEISKFTRGAKDQLVITGLDSPFANPTRILTNADTKNVYILDPNNARIVKLDKTGAYQAQFTSDVLKKAHEFEIVEKDNKAFVLSDNKIWEIALQ